MSAPKPRRRGCLLPTIFLMLATTFVCGAFSWFVLRAPSTDALAELKTLALYPSATSASFNGNTEYEKTGQEVWETTNGIMVSDRQRTLAITVASITFKTGDTPNIVEQFYDDQISKSGYYQIPSQPPSTRYIRYETPFQFLESISEIIFDRDINHPVTFYDINLTALEGHQSSDPSTPVTNVSIELRILRETGGLR